MDKNEDLWLEPISFEELVKINADTPKELQMEVVDTNSNDSDDITEKVISKEEPKKKPYDLRRNGVELVKTDLRYIYQLYRGGGFVYRLYHKDSKTDTFVMKDPATIGIVGKNGKVSKGSPFFSKESAYRHMLSELEKLDKDKAYKGKNITFGDVWEQYKKSEHEKENETIRRYDSIFKHHVSYEFGNRPIKEIFPIDYNEYFVKMYRDGDGHASKQDGYAFSYVESILKYIWLVIHYAYKKYYLTTDYITRFENEIKMPSKIKPSDNRQIRVLTTEQISKIKELLKDTDFYLPFLISLLGGLRPAETFALTFEDFDFTKKTITINKQVVEESGGKRKIKKPKSQINRTVVVPDIVFDEVKKRKERLLKTDKLLLEQNKIKFIDNRELKNEIIDQPNFINVDEKGRYISSHSFSKKSREIRNNICPDDDEYEDFSFYTFRKTHLSNMATANCPIGELMKRAGHLKIETLYKSYYATTEASTDKLSEALEELTRKIRFA